MDATIGSIHFTFYRKAYFLHNREELEEEGSSNIIGGVNRIHLAESGNFRELLSPLHEKLPLFSLE